MSYELEKAQVMFKLARNNKWGNNYDRTEHFKRFQNLSIIIKELAKIDWLIQTGGKSFLGISLNNQYKKEIIAFIETHLPHLKGDIS